MWPEEPLSSNPSGPIVMPRIHRPSKTSDLLSDAFSEDDETDRIRTSQQISCVAI